MKTNLLIAHLNQHFGLHIRRLKMHELDNLVILRPNMWNINKLWLWFNDLMILEQFHFSIGKCRLAFLFFESKILMNFAIHFNGECWHPPGTRKLLWKSDASLSNLRSALYEDSYIIWLIIALLILRFKKNPQISDSFYSEL